MAGLVITETGNALPFQPKAVPPASVATGGADAEKLQSLLISVADVEITVQNPDAPMDFDEFSLTGNLRVDDGLSDAVKDMQLNNACAVATKFESIAGVLSYSFDNSKLMPRDQADLVLGPNNACDPWP
jgi:hypothetical protein